MITPQRFFSVAQYIIRAAAEPPWRPMGIWEWLEFSVSPI